MCQLRLTVEGNDDGVEAAGKTEGAPEGTLGLGLGCCTEGRMVEPQHNRHGHEMSDEMKTTMLRLLRWSQA